MSYNVLILKIFNFQHIILKINYKKMEDRKLTKHQEFL